MPLCIRSHRRTNHSLDAEFCQWQAPCTIHSVLLLLGLWHQSFYFNRRAAWCCIGMKTWDTQKTHWNNWLKDLTMLSKIRTPRCLKRAALAGVPSWAVPLLWCVWVRILSSVLHQDLWRWRKHQDSRYGKARVVPIKPLTIPRLEFSDIVEVGLHQQAYEAIEYRVRKVFFSTDYVNDKVYQRHDIMLQSIRSKSSFNHPQSHGHGRLALHINERESYWFSITWHLTWRQNKSLQMA